MFTGIVEQLGELVSLDRRGPSAVIAVRGSLATDGTVHGDSIAVNGVCLTVVTVEGDIFTADVMQETFERSSLGALRVGDRVNLERAATLQTRLGGHLVSGHVDGVGVIASRMPGERWESVRFALPPELNKYVVGKGSIAVDGISLTVVDVDPDSFSVGLIPTTLELTTLGYKDVGAQVNLEVDMIAKYVEKMVKAI
ncbi:MAG: riboflavin synthase [Longispora sp.]|nr:riboflavin synthase [Longispora sp. (in: high G+C Gram-positive bacteria)]